MYPHGDPVRRRRVGQPPLAPQHLLGMPQQGAGVIMPMPNQPVQILQQNQHQHQHYPSQNSYPPGQQNNAPPYVPQQPNPGNYHQQQQYPHSNTQVVLTKQAVNHNKHYRDDYNVVKESSPYGIKDTGYSGDKQYVSSNYNYNQNTYNGQQNPTSQTSASQQPSQSQSQQQSQQPPSHQQKPQTMANTTNSTADESSSSQDEETPAPDSTTKETSGTASAASAKEKTPMCLVNELARYNKIDHQYRLTNEQGPAHRKSFTVTLNLGSEEYTAEGPSIKKAQHAAAADALRKTKYSHPTPKHNKHIHMANMTPTVELNALAMKRGEPAIYKVMEHPHVPIYQPHQTYTFRRPYGMRGANRRCRFLFPRGSRMPFRPPYSPSVNYTVSLKVGTCEFIGDGNTPQSARHDAAAKALAQLRQMPLPDGAVAEPVGVNVDQDIDSSVKSPISLVHEIALKRNMSVTFQVISEKGPPHMKTFITECIVGEFKAQGEGNGKKVSKKRAAENMLQELKKLPPLSPSLACTLNLSRFKRKPAQAKKKTRNLIKITQDSKQEEVAEEMNPISRLIQIQQVKKEREPIYTLLEEKGMHRRREFVMEVVVGQLSATGTGPNKKLAKKYAAQNLLNIIEGKSTPEATSSKGDANKEAKAEKSDGSGGSSGRQLVPGLLLVSEQQGFNKPTSGSIQTTAKIAQELLTGGSSPTADAMMQKPQPKVFRPKDQLLYLADLLQFQVQFSDYPKANHKEFLTLVSLSTVPPQVCHGAGATVEESQDQAASTALRALSEMGLDSVSPKDPPKMNQGGVMNK